MKTNQCIFVDEEKNVHSGIHCTEDNCDDYIICLCCGGIIDPEEVITNDLESWVSFDELDEIAAEHNTKIELLREAEENIRTYIENCGDIEICFDEGRQDIHDFQGFEINPLSL